MTKVLFVALIDYSDASNGVTKKVKAEIEGIRKLGVEVDLACYYENGGYIIHKEENECFVKFNKTVKRRISFFRELKEILKVQVYDCYYIRYPRCDFSFNSLLKELSIQEKPIIIEIPTYPIPKLSFSKEKWLQFLLSKQEVLFFKKMANRTTLFVTIGNKVENICGTKAICIPNGIDVDQVVEQVRVKESSKREQLNMLTVSEMFNTHGYDRLLEGLHQYVSENSHLKKLHIDMIGDGPELPRYINLCKKYHLENMVTFVGRKYGEELDEYYKKCDIAVSGLAPFREGLMYASPLKTKEYMARGIPFVYAYEEIGLPNDYPYAYKFPNDESPIDFKRMLEFYEQFTKNEEYNKLEMRKIAEKYFDWKEIFKNIFRISGVM